MKIMDSNEILEAENHRLKEAAKGRGMVSEMDNWEELAVLVCGLQDRVELAESELAKERESREIAEAAIDNLCNEQLILCEEVRVWIKAKDKDLVMDEAKGDLQAKKKEERKD